MVKSEKNTHTHDLYRTTENPMAIMFGNKAEG